MIRNAYLKKIEERLHKLDAEIDHLGKKTDAASAGAKAEVSRQVEALRRKAEIARNRVREVREAGTATWGRLKKQADDAVEDARKDLGEVIRKLRKTG